MKQLNILFIEDDDDDVFLLKRVCKSIGIETINFVANGRRAIEFLAPLIAGSSNGFPLIFLDVNMPVMNGFDFLRWLRGEAALRSVPVIMLSTSDNSRDIATAYELGANAYLVKAHSLDELTNSLGAAYNFWAHFNRIPPLEQWGA